MSRRLPLAALALLAAVLVPAGVASACPPKHWVTAWAASPGSADAGDFADQTLRMIVTPHLGGRHLRLRLSNRFGRLPVTFDTVTVGRRRTGPDVAAASLRAATFAGATTVTIPPRSEVVSDPVRLRYAAFKPLAVSLSVLGSSGPATEHLIGQQTSYITPRGSGNHAGDASGAAFGQTTTRRYYLTAVDALAPASSSALVTFGDSYTDGYLGSSSPLEPNTAGIDADGRLGDALRRRLLAMRRAPNLSVANAGITGNRLLAGGIIPEHGPSALSRFRADVAGLSGVSHVLILTGTNDIGARSATVEEITAGLGRLVARARRAGLRVLLGTLPPAAGALSEDYGDAEADAMRSAVNDWIRASSGADAVVDFDAVLRDPDEPSRLAPHFDSGDRLHPNLDGYRAMADAVAVAALEAEPPTVPVGLRRGERRGLRRAVVTADGRRVGVIRRPRQTVDVPVGDERVVVRLRITRAGRPPARRVLRLGPC